MKKVLTVFLVLLLLLGGGGLILAQQADAAEPGDTLYPVDILAENIQRVLITDDIKKTEFEEEVLGERISELASLSEGNENVDEILQAVSEQQERVRKQLNILENNPEKYSDNAVQQAQNRYEQQLEQHIEVMEQIQNKGEDTAIEVKQNLQENLDSCRSGSCGAETSGNSESGGNSQGDSTNGNDSGQQGSSDDMGQDNSNNTNGDPNN